MMHAGGEEHDAAVLAGTRLGQPEHVAIEAARGVEVADKQRDVTELADLHRVECLR
jgi:hypothetical protein